MRRVKEADEMAGHFLLWDVTQTDINEMRGYPGFTLSEVMHRDVGWTNASSLTLSLMKNGNGIVNRAGLPPHQYLTFPGGAPVGGALQVLTSQEHGWVHGLERRSEEVGLGLRELCDAARTRWTLNDKLGALIAQITHGSTSIEIYKIGSKKIE